MVDSLDGIDLPTVLPLPASARPIAQPIGAGWMPVIYHPERAVEYLRFARYPRKTKATADEALAYAAKVIAWREHFAGYKRRRREAVEYPRNAFLQAAE